MHEHLHPWFMKWIKDRKESGLAYKGSANSQIMYVRDGLAPLIWADIPYEERPCITDDDDDYDRPVTGYIISTHPSKSVLLPVYSLERPDLGLQIVLRNNFYNWKMSVISDEPIDVDLTGLCYTASPREPEYTGDCLSPVYFEGFPRELVFGYYDESDHRRWSAELYEQESVWMAIFLVCRARGIIKAKRQHTQEEHRAKLDRSRAFREQRKTAAK